jgi:hypothetical protein
MGTNEEKEKMLRDLIEAFKKKLAKAAEEAISDVYSDCLPFVLDDTQRNAQFIAEQAMQMFLNGQPEMMHGISLPWDQDYVALKLYAANKDLIENAIIKAQQEWIDRLKWQLDTYRNR